MLWQKELHRDDEIYVDLLGSPSIDSIFKEYKSSITPTSDLLAEGENSALLYREQGNQHFAEKKWFTAMMFYNKSICCVEEGSELMGLAYANRSSCFFHLKMYAKCLVDIENAKRNNYPLDKMDKLDARKATCLSKLETEIDQSEVFEPKLDYVPNEMFPCLADVLQIENIRKYGRHIVAKADIEVGKTVMVDECFFAESITQKYARCAKCMRLGENLKPCNNCSFTMHCPRCEGNNFHAIECTINPSYMGTTQFFSFRMVIIRSILLAMNSFDDADELIAVVEEMLSSDEVKAPESLCDSQSKYRAFFKLLPKPKHQVDEHLPQKIYFIHRLLGDAPNVAKFFHSKTHQRFLLHLIGHHVLTIANFIQNDKSLQIPFGVDFEVFSDHRMSIAASYFNHSCIPNAQVKPQNGVMTCVVLRPVRKGEQLCIAYDDMVLLKPKLERQEELQSKFKFQCKCDRCERPEVESSCLKSDRVILSDPDYWSLIQMDPMEAIKGQYFQNILSVKANTMRLLKKYGNAVWSDELIRIISFSHCSTLIERKFGPLVPMCNLLSKDFFERLA